MQVCAAAKATTAKATTAAALRVRLQAILLSRLQRPRWWWRRLKQLRFVSLQRLVAANILHAR